MTEAPRFHVVLIRPEIPGNTGNVGRSCMALGCRLHLVHPLGFEISSSRLKRAGMDYWTHVDLAQHDSLEAWLESLTPETELWLFDPGAERAWDPTEAGDGATLVFGSESSGLPPELLERWRSRARRIPMDPRARSLNLSSCVAMVLGSLFYGRRMEGWPSGLRHRT